MTILDQEDRTIPRSVSSAPNILFYAFRATGRILENYNEGLQHVSGSAALYESQQLQRPTLTGHFVLQAVPVPF